MIVASRFGVGSSRVGCFNRSSRLREASFSTQYGMLMSG